MIPKAISLKNKVLPEMPGVYLMRDVQGRILYVGKAGNLRRRVESYFSRPNDTRIEKLMSEVRQIGYKKTDTALEALILEAELIKQYAPPFNVKEKDDKSFLYVEITKENFPRVLLARGKDALRDERQPTKLFGPFTSASHIREALKILRKIFPWSTHPMEKIGKLQRPCLDYELGLCPGTCIGRADTREYRKNIRNLERFFSGKKKVITSALLREMAVASKKLEFEKAEKLRRQIFALQHIRDTALINEPELTSELKNRSYRIEGYDVSNISGTLAVGSMVVFQGGSPQKTEYRKFKIRTVMKSDDVGMLKEVLRRRFRNNWPFPHLILVDGGRAHVNAAKSVVSESNLKIPIVGIAKGQTRKRNDFYGVIPVGSDKKTLIAVRDEAHRSAIAYHQKLRTKEFLN